MQQKLCLIILGGAEMKKFKPGEMSKIDIPSDIDIFFPMRSVAFAELLGLKKASISVAIKENRIVADEKKQIRLVDNPDYLVGRLQEEIIRMSEEQRNNVTTLINRITEARKELYKKGELIYPGQARPVQQQQQQSTVKPPAKSKRLNKFKLQYDTNYTIYYLFENQSDYIPVLEVGIFPADADDKDDYHAITINGIEPFFGAEIYIDGNCIVTYKGNAENSKEYYIKEQIYYST